MRTFCLVAAVAALLAGAACPVVGQPLAEGTFDRPGDLQGWQPNGHLTNVVVTNGSLNFRAVGSDPILELKPLLDFAASAFQVVEVRLKADRDGTAELFWSNSSTGRYGGFSQEKSTRFNVTGDGQWHTYRLLPCWQTEGRIVRLRFDLYDGAKFELDSFQVLQLATNSAAIRADFDFNRGTQGWQWLDTLDDPARFDWTGGAFQSSPGGLLLSPPVQIDTTNLNCVAVRMAADRGRLANLFFASTHKPGLHSFSFPIESDGREHTYNLDLSPAADWRGQVVALGLRPSDATNAKASLRWLKVADAPQGPAQLKIASFGMDEALPRVGHRTTLKAVISNVGGTSARDFLALLQLPPGIELMPESVGQLRVPPLGFQEEATLSWRLFAPQPVSNAVRLVLASTNAEPVSGFAPARFTPRPNVPKLGHVPEPKPVRGPVEVGVYYFPGWKHAGQWQPIQRFPEREPVLGWYREGDPEVADWHIKWAVEHGITFFAYDWYWSQGARQLEHALHDGYFKARYRHLLKFCLLWANHNAPGTSSYEDCLAVTRYWIEHYFRRPEHLTFDGQPVMIIFSPHRLTEDLGSEGVKRAFEAMREECRRAGLKGLHLIACIGDLGGARAAAAEGYDAVTAYNWPHLGMTGEGMFAPFETLVPAFRRQWEHLLAKSPIPLTPLPVCGGWDSRPWHGENNLVRFGRTPELFRRHLLDAREVLHHQRPESKSQKAILIEAWNEWGEGSYIEPHSEFGFGYLDAISEVFTDAPAEHDDITPADAGLGPYDVPPLEPPRTAWEFEHDDEGWNSTMQLSEVTAVDGRLRARTTGNDPAFFGPPMQARTAEFSTGVVRMRLRQSGVGAPRDVAQLFWRTSRMAESESTSERFSIHVDGQWHEYRVPVGQNPRWRGVITRLRLDPGTRPNVEVDLDFIRLAE
ncbi:MAG: glycoside hydrolase family 99-like domain-containing protein [Verrucomicrobia bacterium]|nr:glycoside hydrolase family 99-like domain-containing protein [Verrucomicrobiota bacterium]